MKNLMQEARNAMANSFSPYSNFKVGAAALLKDGTIITGCNVENASYGLCNCAERTTLFTAYAKGIRKDDIVSFSVCAYTKDPVSPCGACRQVMSELLNHDVVVYLTNDKGDVKEMTVGDLLPYSFNEVE